MRKLAIILLVLLLSGCEAPNTDPSVGLPEAGNKPGVYVIHDDERGVTCWVTQTSYGAGIDCMADREFGE